METVDPVYHLLHSIWTVAAFTFFVVVAAWTFWPSHKNRIEGYGRIPLDDDTR